MEKIMQLPVNPFKHAIAAGTPQIGLWSMLSSHITVEILGGAGFDWLTLDTEHAPSELPMILSQLQAAKGGTAHPVVRVPWNDRVTIKRYLDIGAQTILIPYVETADQARDAVAATRYPPKGVRGFAGGARASLYGRVEDYAQRCEEELCVLVQVETALGVENIEAIAAVDGIDGLFIGPGDLSADMGYLGQMEHPTVRAAIDDAIKRIRACGKPAGILTADDALAHHYLELGCVFIAVGSDVGLLARHAEALAARFKTAG
jgi:4-hydroxy-2-oxoheptanedioate aldolase